MPFEQFVPKPFNISAVRTHAPAASGIYGMSNAREWIYIGETDNIQGALLAHLGNLQTSPMQCAPTGFVYEICERGQRPRRQDRLVFEYEPVCNRAASRQQS